MIIRPFRNTDAQEVSDLIVQNLREINAKYYPESVINHMIEFFQPKNLIEIANKRMLLVCHINEEIIGFAQISENYFGSVFVKPLYHGKGAGRKLMDTLELLAKKNGRNSLMLHSSINAVQFYEKRGYRMGRMVNDETFGDSFEMMKDL